MKELGINQAELSRRSGVSKQTISDYVTRKRLKPDPDALASIAKALRLQIETIYQAAGIPTTRNLNLTSDMDAVIEAMQDLPESWQAMIAEDARRTRQFYEQQERTRIERERQLLVGKRDTGKLPNLP